MEKNYVVMYTKATCDMGCMENYLNVVTDHGVYKLGADGQPYPVLNAKDNADTIDEEHPSKNIPSFGKCSSPTNPDYDDQKWHEKFIQNVKNIFNGDGKCPCVPDIVTEWYDTNQANMLEGSGCLTQSSKIACTKGGIISIVVEKAEE